MSLKRAKKKARSLTAPPTHDEMQELKKIEAEFESNMFKLELDELLRSLRAKKSHVRRAEEAVHRLKESLEKMAECEVSAAQVLPAHVVVSDREARVHVLPPRSVHVIGSFLLESVAAPRLNIDVAVEMAPQMIARADRKNYGYHDKRALFLGAIAAHLGGDAQWTTFANDRRKPVLEFPAGSFTVRVYPFFFQNSRLPLAKLLPHRSNLDAAEGEPTPLYNCSIAEDTQLVNHLQAMYQVLKDAPCAAQCIMLLKVWSRQRGLFFNGFHAAMLVVHLIQSGYVSRAAHAYPMLKAVWTFLSKGLESIAPDEVKAAYEAAFPSVFVDPSGSVNLFARMSVGSLHELKAHATASLRGLRTWVGGSGEGFRGLFLDPAPMWEGCDVMLRVPFNADLKRPALVARNCVAGDADLYAGSRWANSFRMAQVLREGLADRASIINLRIREDTCEIGLRLNAATAYRQVDLGPAANSGADAQAFRRLWGEKSELRRFRDGRILEACVWECPLEERPLIPQRIARHLLELHFGATVLFRDQQLVNLMAPQQDHVRILQTFEKLRLRLIALDLPLEITDVWTLHPALRKCAVFPPQESGFAASAHTGNSQSLVLEPLDVAIKFAGSSEWPDELEPLQTLKQAFLVQICRELQPTTSFLDSTGSNLDVLFGGYVFRLSIFQPRELQMNDARISRQLLVKYPLLAHHVSTFNGLTARFPVLLEAARLAKRFLNAHLFSGLFMDPWVEITMARVFLRHLPHATAPAAALPAFLRWLRLLATFSWEDEVLTVPAMGNTLSPEQMAIAEREFSQRKHRVAPFVASEYDPASEWTRKKPSGPVFARMRRLAAAALTVPEQPDSFLLQMFAHSFVEYHHVLRLNLAAIPTYYQSIGAHLRKRGLPEPSDDRKLWVVPQWKNLRKVTARSDLLIGFDPVAHFIAECRDRFGSLALFLYDEHGGDRIGIVWKPSAFEPQEPSMRRCFAAKPLQDGSGRVVTDTDDVLRQIRWLGEGLVDEQ